LDFKHSGLLITTLTISTVSLSFNTHQISNPVASQTVSHTTKRTNKDIFALHDIDAKYSKVWRNFKTYVTFLHNLRSNKITLSKQTITALK